MPRMTQSQLTAHELKMAQSAARKLAKAHDRGLATEMESKGFVFEKLDQREVGAGGIQEQIKTYLKSLGVSCTYCWHRTDVPATTEYPEPDFIGGYMGRAFAMEVKRRGQKQTRDQAGRMMQWNLCGHAVAVVHSLNEAKVFIGGLASK
jgi:hypothetical protein